MAPLECQVLKKSVTYPRGGGELRGHPEGLFCTYCVSSVASELTPPPRAGYAFLQYLALQGCPGNSPVWATLAQNGPLFGQFFSKIPGSHPTPSPKSEKKVGNPPPLGHPPGGKTALFSGIRRLHSLGARDLPKIVYFRGAPL